MSELTDIKETYIDLRDRLYTNLRKRQELHQQIYEGTFETGLEPAPGGKQRFRIFIGPEGRMIIERPVNHIAMDKIVVSQEPMRKGPSGYVTKKAEKEANKVEKWLGALLELWGLVSPYHLRESVKNLTLRGEVFSRIRIDNRRILEPENYEGNPFSLWVPDARTVYATLDMVDGRPTLVYEESVRGLGGLRKDIAKWNGEDVPFLVDEKDSRLVSVVEWWTEEERGFFAGIQGSSVSDWQAVPIDREEKIPNEYGFMPWGRGYSGYGMTPDDGDPAKLAVGILTGLESALKGKARGASMIDTNAAYHALPAANIFVKEGHPIPQEDMDFSPGVSHYLGGAIEKTEWMRPPDLPPAVVAMYQAVSRQLEEFMPGIVGGANEGTEAGVSRAARLNQASLLWEPIYQEAKRVLENMLGLVLRAIDTIPQLENGVELKGIRFSKEDIKGHYQVYVEIEPGNPDALRWDALLGTDLQTKGVISHHWNLEHYQHFGDPDEEISRIEVENINKTDPRLRAYKVRRALIELGREDELAILEAEGPEGPVEGGPAGAEGLPPTGQVKGLGGSPTRGITPGPQMVPPERLRAWQAAQKILGRQA